jgi:hypothetical protein
MGIQILKFKTLTKKKKTIAVSATLLQPQHFFQNENLRNLLLPVWEIDYYNFRQHISSAFNQRFLVVSRNQIQLNLVLFLINFVGWWI